MKKNILFLNYTEIQFLLSHIYFEKYFNYTEYAPIYLFINSNKERFKDINLELIPGEKYFYKNDLNFIKTLRPDKAFLRIYDLGAVDRIIFSNPAYFINYSIINFFKRKNKNLKLTLISDGVGLDVKESFKYKFIAALKLFIRRSFNNIPNLSPLIWTYNGLIKSGKIDTFISNSNKVNDNCLQINASDLLQNGLNNNKLIYKYFNIPKFEKNIDFVLFTQGIDDFVPKLKHEINDILNTLFALISKYNKTIVIKPHPSEHESKYNKYLDANVLLFREKNVPGEILTSLFSGAISISLYSSVGYVNNKKAKNHYWLFPLIKSKIYKNINVGETISRSLKKENNIILIKTVSDLENLIKRH